MEKMQIRKARLGIRPIRVLPLGFLVIILIGTMLLMLPVSSKSGAPLSFADALFTATSASCVTGLVVVDTGTYFTLFGQIVILLLIQIGGLGFMTMATILFGLMGRRISLRERMTMAEGLGESRLQGVVRLCRAALTVTFIAEGVGMLLLAPCFVRDYGFGKGLWYGLFHSVSAFCNAGFDLIGGFRSVTVFSDEPYLLFVIMALIVTGGLGFSVIQNIWKKRSFRALSLNAKIVLCGTLGLLVLGTLLVLVIEYDNPVTLGNMPFFQKLYNALFQSVTFRTAGFNSIDQLGLRDATKGLGVVLMLCGGAPAGTAGGLKVTTIVTLLLAVRAYTRGRTDTIAFGRTIPLEQVRRALTVFVIGILYLAGMTILISAIEQNAVAGDFGLLNQLYEITSALCTVGLSDGVTAAAGKATRMLLASMMYVGRVGLLTLMMSLADPDESTNALHYPKENILIG